MHKLIYQKMCEGIKSKDVLHPCIEIKFVTGVLESENNRGGVSWSLDWGRRERRVGGCDQREGVEGGWKV